MILRETANYSYISNRIMGCGRWERKADNFSSLWNTGSDHALMCLQLDLMTEKEFDSVAANQDYSE